MRACDLCASTDNSIIKRGGRDSDDIVVLKCNICGLVYLKDTYSKEDYANGTFSLDARGSVIPTEAKFRSSEATAMDRFQFIRDDVASERYLVDVGCGLGSLVKLCTDTGWKAEGIEPDVEMAKAGSKKYGITIHTSYFDDTDLENVGIITMFDVLEHVESPTDFLKRAHQVLADHGKLVIQYPSLEVSYGGDLDKFYWSPHLYYFSKETIKTLLSKTGFAPGSVRDEGWFTNIVAVKL